jgi:hypothetical protein
LCIDVLPPNFVLPLRATAYGQNANKLAATGGRQVTRRRLLSKCRPRGISEIRHLLSFGDRVLRKKIVYAPLPTHAFTDPAALGLQRLDFTSSKPGQNLAATSHQIGIKSGPQLAIHKTNVVPAAPR